MMNIKKITIIAASLFFGMGIYAQHTAKGTVFNDLNGNGKKDRNESGIANVPVSNGTEVVLTDEKGNYKLPVGHDNIIFVIKPKGYAIPSGDRVQSQFYYIHKPLGSPATYKYKGVQATGKLPESINFALKASKEPENFTSLIFGDPQPASLEELEYFKKGIVDEASQNKDIAFGISLGDLAFDRLDLHRPYMDIIKGTGIPWHNVMGNHDMNYEAVADALSDETFEQNIGPANYAFNYAGAHVLILDDILYPDPRDNAGYWGGFRPDQLEFIANDLKYADKSSLIIISVHIPLQHENENSFRDADRKKLFELLKDFPNVLVLSAHTHLQRQNFYSKAEGWLQEKPLHEYNAGTTNGDWYSGEFNEIGVPVSTMRDGTPRGYALLNVSGNQYTIDYKVANKPKDYQINIFHPIIVARNQGTSAMIVANFFMGHKNDKVEFRIDNGEWKPMRHTEAPDPDYIFTLFSRDRSDTLKQGKRPSNPTTCTHLWSAPIPTRLESGTHTIEVKATDMFGRAHHQKSQYKVE